MTEENHCYENSLAERINKTLKFEFGLHNTFNCFKEAQIALNQAVFLYNNVRPHESLLFETPSSFENKFTKNRRNHGSKRKLKHIASYGSQRGPTFTPIHCPPKNLTSKISP
ncbi:integrase core domain-containing protein [Leptospira alexanderi]|uniref:integrase core domain-containing protein n=1 Tax=Leptospira alexanderi TaxID=100053 RepID=UPI002014CEBA|nr:integrase core domain-containing protein [Leptospira alexanderi]